MFSRFIWSISQYFTDYHYKQSIFPFFQIHLISIRTALVKPSSSDDLAMTCWIQSAYSAISSNSQWPVDRKHVIEVVGNVHNGIVGTVNFMERHEAVNHGLVVLVTWGNAVVDQLFGVGFGAVAERVESSSDDGGGGDTRDITGLRRIGV